MPSPLTVSVIKVLHSSTLKGSMKHYHTFRGIMYGYSEVRATRAATCSLYIIPVRCQTYCQPDRK